MHPLIRAILQPKFRRGDRTLRLRWLVALSTLPALGIMGAYALAPHLDINQTPTRTAVEEVPLPAVPAQPKPADLVNQTVIERGDTAGDILGRLNVHDNAAFAFISQNKTAHQLYQLHPGEVIAARTTPDGRLLELRYDYAPTTTLVITRQNDSFTAHDIAPPTTTKMAMRSGEIRSSFFGATDRANVPDAIAIAMTDIFSSEIDFRRDLHRGDRFSVIFEQTWRDGRPVANGRILAAEFINQGKAYKAVWFEDGSGHGAYYSPDGKSLRRAFLRAPLEFSRITSRFTPARWHPILKEWKAHKGVDYAAPIGTKVKATADGVVRFAGRETGYGNVIILDHQRPYSTVYGHLSRFAQGIHHGVHVHQGQVIGYVGMTGWATGPHLHYEFRVNNVQRNPLSVAVPHALPLPAHALAKFKQATAPLVAKLNLLLPDQVASR